MRSTVREVGQRFMVGFDGLAASADIRRLIREFGLGHVILFARNVDSPEQVAELVRELQAIAREAGHDLPLLIAIDQEGGKVQRLRAPWTVWPPLPATVAMAWPMFPVPMMERCAMRVCSLIMKGENWLMLQVTAYRLWLYRQVMP